MDNAIGLRIYAKQDSACVWRIFPDSGLIMELTGRNVHVLNVVGSEIWELVDGTRDVNAIAREIEQRFEVDFERACTDVAAFLSELHSKGLCIETKAVAEG